MSRMTDESVSVPETREAPTLATLIEQQTKLVSNLQGYAAQGENGPDVCRLYGTALSTAIDKLATLDRIRVCREGGTVP